MLADFLILGAGFTAARVARRLVEAGADVVVTNRERKEIAGARCLGLSITAAANLRPLAPFLASRTVILHSIPILSGTPELVEFLRPFRPARIVYLSTTGVYGAAERVDEHTVPSPETEKDKERMEAETALAQGPWSTMVLRPAGIYGPSRGVHWSAKQGKFRPVPGNRVVSRIHVDDLTEHALRAMQCGATGAFPVADEEACPSSEVAEWTRRYLGIPFDASALEKPKGGRCVDGSAVRAVLGVELLYRSFREGVAACLEEESRGDSALGSISDLT
jgi:nucleoside-diphosphate-sugar epimerase